MIKNGKSIPAVILIFLPIVIYLVYTISNSASLFFADDFHLLKTVLWIQDVDGIFEKLNLLVQQHNEHRIVLPRLLTLLDYKIEGSINWPTLILIGNLLWIANLWFFWEGFKSFNIPVWMFIAIPFIFLQPQYTDNVTWAISILQQSVIVFWYSLLTYLCSKNKYRAALLIAVIATFTHGNGIFSFIIGIILASFDRRWRTAMVWGSVWIFVGLIYFWGFQKGQAADFGKSLSDPVRLIASFFAFFGAVTKVRTPNVYYTVFLGGILVLSLAVYLIPKLKTAFTQPSYRLAPFDKMLLGNVLFLGITAALVCVSRSWGGIDNVLAPRYQHYSPYVICWVYVVILSFLSGKNRTILAGISIPLAIIFNALCYFSYNDDVQLRKNWQIADETNWINHELMVNYAASFNHNIKEPYQRAVTKGICKSESKLPEISDLESSKKRELDLNFSDFTINDMDASGVYAHNYKRIKNEKLTGETFLYLQKTGAPGYWIASKIPHTGILEFFSSGRLSKSGFEAEFMTENLLSGTYKIGVLNNGQFGWTDQTVAVK